MHSARLNRLAKDVVLEMRIHSDDAVKCGIEQARNHALADRLALGECLVLPHIGQIGRDEHKATNADPSPGIGGKQQLNQLGVGPAE
jgi:hypothetical protein